MTDKEKMQDPLIWRRMGLELAALHDLMTGILCDPEYNAVMDKKTWSGLAAAINRLDAVRSDAEDRMSRYVPEWSPRIFYPRDRKATNAAGEAFRQKIAEAAQIPVDLGKRRENTP